MPPYRVTRHLWWNATHTALVPTGDPAAAVLAYPAGSDIPEGDARRLGLVAPAAKVRRGRPSDKMGAAPQNKSTTPLADPPADPTISTEETP